MNPRCDCYFQGCRCCALTVGADSEVNVNKSDELLHLEGRWFEV